MSRLMRHGAPQLEVLKSRDPDMSKIIKWYEKSASSYETEKIKLVAQMNGLSCLWCVGQRQERKILQSHLHEHDGC
jgi:hypothetical protein